MRRELIATLAGLLVAGAAFAQPVTYQFSSKACETNAAAQTTYAPDSDIVVHGFVDAVIVDQTGTGTGTVTVATLAGPTGASRSILSIATQSADAVYPARDLAATQAGVDITGEPVKIPLVGDKLRVTLFNWGATNNTASIYVVVTPES